ncbi:MAG TPA: beta-N-acetylhexosaminidase [Alphaproteobacteria bacterium]|nr:beta-N-acetylhexosaminidase [Alphaproteobacteria bacterium]
MSNPEARPRAAIFGCAGPELLEPERRFFATQQPLGFILFERNCKNPDQTRELIDSLRGCVGRADAPVLIDQEGGRVARLKPPHWRALPPAGRIGALARTDRDVAREAAYIAARLIAADLEPLGIDVDCAPVLDVPAPGSHGIIGDRAFCDEPYVVADLGKSFCRGLLEGGVLPVIKHIPGHGRATVDSHAALPEVAVHRQTLEAVDFVPFRALNDMPFAMTAHVVYRAYERGTPATTSAKVIADVIRGRIGFDGLLITDDLSMKALKGSFAERTKAALEAGCDLVLHCNGKMEEMAEVASACAPLSDPALARLAWARSLRAKPASVDIKALAARLDSLLTAAAA